MACTTSSALEVINSPDFFETDRATALLCIQLSLQRVPSALPPAVIQSLICTLNSQLSLSLKEDIYKACLACLLLQITFFSPDGLSLFLQLPTSPSLLQLLLNPNNLPSLYQLPYFR